MGEVLYAPQLRYLLVVLAGDSEAAQDGLRRLQPSSQALAEAHTGGQLVGVIVTAQGAAAVPARDAAAVLSADQPVAAAR